MTDEREAAGINTDETPQEAAEHIWGETKHDPVETMRLFEEWARQEPERMLGVLGKYWLRAVRGFLSRDVRCKGGLTIGPRFAKKLRDVERQANVDQHSRRTQARRGNLSTDGLFRIRSYERDLQKLARDRRKKGVKVIRAAVDLKTGEVVRLIDKEFGPFAHIRINGLRLAEVTRGEALWYCDHKTDDVQFVRALCSLLPDPHKPIGEQWTAEIIKEAKRLAGDATKANRPKQVVCEP